MTKNIDSRKIKLIEEIAHLSDEREVQELEDYLQNLKWKGIVKPIRSSITIEDLKKEQNYSPISKMEFDNLVSQLDIQEPIEQLLEMLD